MALATSEFVQLLAKKLELSIRLRESSASLEAMVTSGEWSGLMGLLATKQQTLLEMQSVDQELAPHRDTPPEARIWASATEKDRAQRMARACQELLGEVVEIEKRAESLANQKRADVEARLRSSQASGAASGVYLSAHDAGASSLNAEV